MTYYRDGMAEKAMALMSRNEWMPASIARYSLETGVDVEYYAALSDAERTPESRAA